MKKVINFFTKIVSLQYSVQGTAQSIALALAFLCLTAQVYGQDEKKISYPVEVQVERAPVSAPENKPVEKTQEDAIRSLYETASTSSAARKSTKQRSEKPTTKSAKKTTETKSTAKTANKIAPNKKSIAAKPEPKIAAKKITETKPAPPPATIAKSSVAANVNPEPTVATTSEILSSTTTLEKTSATAPVAIENTIQHSAPANNAAPLAVTSEAAGEDEDELDDSSAPENRLTEGTASENAFTREANTGSAVTASAVTGGALAEGAAPESESVPVQPASIDATAGAPATPVVAAVKNIPLPISNVREAYITEFKKYVEDKIAPRVPGIAIAVIADGKVKVLQAYGVKRAGTREFIDADTAFRLASCSKTIAGTTAGILVNDGILNWATPVISVLPNVQFSNPRYGNQLSLRDILSQSTGLPTHSGDNYIEEGLPFDAVVQKLKSVNFVCPPGKCYAYQNVSFSLFDGMVRNKTGKPYEQYVQEKLFNPLGMQTASFGLVGLKAHNNYALPHVATNKGWYTEKITENYYRMHPAAGANASITDMARWVLAQMGHNPDVLSPSILNSIHDKVTKNTPAQSHYGARDGVTDTHYGIGWRIFDYRGDKNFIHHGGYVLGFQSQMVFNTELQIGMVALSNSNKMPTNIIFDFLDAYEDEKRGPRKIILPAVTPLIKKRPPQKGR